MNANRLATVFAVIIGTVGASTAQEPSKWAGVWTATKTAGTDRTLKITPEANGKWKVECVGLKGNKTAFAYVNKGVEIANDVMSFIPDFTIKAPGARQETAIILTLESEKLKYTATLGNNKSQTFHFDRVESKTAALKKTDTPPQPTAKNDPKTPAKGDGPFAEIGKLKGSNGILAFAGALAPDGRRLAIPSSAGKEKFNHVVIWDFESRSAVQKLKSMVGNVSRIAWSADGKTLATAVIGGSINVKGEYAVELWDPDAGELRQSFPLPQFPLDLAISANGSMIAVSGGETNKGGYLNVFDVAEKKETVSLTTNYSIENRTAISADGKSVIAQRAVKGADLAVIDTRTGKTKGSWKIPSQVVAISSDGTTAIATTFGPSSFSLHVVDVASPQKPPRVIKGSDWRVASMVLVDHDKHLIVGGTNSEIQVFDLATGKVDSRWNVPQNGLALLRATPDSSRVATLGQDFLWRLWTTPFKE